MDNLSFEKIWEDLDFYEIKVEANNDDVKVHTRLFVNKSDIVLLSGYIKNIVNLPNDSFYWEIGDTDLSVESFLSIKKIKNDQFGHFWLEINIGFQNDCNIDYYCKFPILTELGLLLSFSEKILSLNQNKNYIKCNLNSNLDE